uniref:Uncharacterized protein n=1 Tax=Rhizophora mucronata TaxID=61149 RepID=A0A2P2PU69_RHIMU
MTCRLLMGIRKAHCLMSLIRRIVKMRLLIKTLKWLTSRKH